MSTQPTSPAGRSADYVKTPKPTGFTETRFREPYPVTLFPASNPSCAFQPTPGRAIGLEKCNVFHGERLIVRYDSEPIRKSTGRGESWPNGVLYCWERDVEGWKDAPSTRPAPAANAGEKGGAL